jgi:hypothetical protein
MKHRLVNHVQQIYRTEDLLKRRPGRSRLAPYAVST